MHEIPNMEKAISKCNRILKPNGRLLILDWEAEVGPPFQERMSSQEMKQFLNF